MKAGDTCTDDASCGGDMDCVTCNPNQMSCARIGPTPPMSKVKGLAFNKYSWLTTHNSFAMVGEKLFTEGTRLAPSNQQDSITSQLNNGVRGLMLDMYDFMNDIWLCHSFGGNCFNFTAFQPAINVLKEIKIFMEANPTEIVTIFVEDYVTTPKGLAKVFDAAGLMKYWFPVDNMPKNGEDWPLVTDMVAKNQRLIVFTSKQAKEALEGVAYVWRYVVENQYGNGGLKAGSCPNRAESATMNNATKSLVLMNYFPDEPTIASSCKDNSASLVDMLSTCNKLSGNRWANFIAVDFYRKSDGGGAPLAADMVNGRLACGCDNINYCKGNTTFGTCEVPQQVETPPEQRNEVTPAPSPSKEATSISAEKIALWWTLHGMSLATVMVVLA